MVFLIQNSQNRNGEAIQAKLDESIRGSTARNSFVGIERLTDEELDKVREKCERRAKAGKISKNEARLAVRKAQTAAGRVSEAMVVAGFLSAKGIFYVHSHSHFH